MRQLVLGVVVLLLFSGCGGRGDGDPTDAPGPGETTPTASFLDIQSNLPEWNLGQGWTYRVERPGLPTETFKMIVAEDRGDLWVVASNNRTQAVNHAVYSTNPMLGRIGKETLSPFQSGEPAEMYQFPLTDGQTWQATFFGQAMTFKAVYAGDIDSTQVNTARNLPKRIDGFRITATGGGVTVTYDYVEAIEWFTAFEVRKNGEREIRLSLADFESAYKGSYFFYRGAPDDQSLVQTGSHDASSVPPTTNEVYEADVPDNFQDFVALGVVYVGRSAPLTFTRLDVTLLRPDGSAAIQQNLVGAREWHRLADVPGVAGTWSLQANMTGTMTFELRVFGVSKYAEGTL